MSEPTGPSILLYSDDVDVREQVRLAVGRRLERGAPEIRWLEVATADEVVDIVRNDPPALLVLDGEADKVGGMGLSRQLKDETTSARRCWCSSAGRRTAGSPRGRTPTAP